MLNLFSSKMRYIGAGMAATVTLVALGVIFGGKMIPDQRKLTSMENSDRKHDGFLHETENAKKEIDEIRQKGDSLIKQADALIVRSRLNHNEKNKTSATDTTAQRISDLKNRLGKSGK